MLKYMPCLVHLQLSQQVQLLKRKLAQKAAEAEKLAAAAAAVTDGPSSSSPSSLAAAADQPPGNIYGTAVGNPSRHQFSQGGKSGFGEEYHDPMWPLHMSVAFAGLCVRWWFMHLHDPLQRKIMYVILWPVSDPGGGCHTERV
jgi:hypothetical protein